MVEVRFRSSADKTLCCDSSAAAAKFGSPLARCLALRLQQLAALGSTDDISLLPTEVRRDGKRWIVGVDAEATLVLTTTRAQRDVGVARAVEIVVVEQILTGGR